MEPTIKSELRERIISASLRAAAASIDFDNDVLPTHDYAQERHSLDELLDEWAKKPWE